MFQVLYALVPAASASFWYFGYGVLINIVLTVMAALASEALILAARRKPLGPFLTDGSAVVAAVLLALCLPPLAPWWLPVIGTAFAIIAAKHLYGGLGFNLFNPAMVGYVLLLLSFPGEMTAGPPEQALVTRSLDLGESLQRVFAGPSAPGWESDAFSGATSLESAKTQPEPGQTMAEVRVYLLLGPWGGEGWVWVSIGSLIGGFWLLYQRIINWRTPLSMLSGILVMTLLFHWIEPAQYPLDWLYLLSGGTLLGAFFIATDPVTAATTPQGRVLYGAGIGILTYIIRTWGSYPGGLAFAVLLMNMAAPTIDYYTAPRVFGTKL